MKAIKMLALAGAVALVAACGVSSAKAGFSGGRQYYGAWRHSSHGYWYCSHYYKPYPNYPTYCYNYCIYYPASAKYVYYYNPYKGTYWGRFDIQTKGYSLLAEKDRGGKLKDIPEKAFPPEGPLPAVPDSKDKVQLEEPTDLPTGEKLDTAVADKPADVAAPANKPEAPAATPAAAAKPDAPAAPVVASAPADKTQPADLPGDLPATPAEAGTGVVPVTEPVNPTPSTGAVAPATGGPAATPTPTAVPVNGGPAPVNGGPRIEPSSPFFPPCHGRFGGCHGY
jgi:hypothetical protein